MDDKKPSGQPLILAVDDSPDQLLTLHTLLSGIECRLATASSGPEAVDIARRDGPDLILLDVVMPGMTGLEVLGELKCHKETRDIPVIFLTVKTDSEDIVAGLTAGASDYVAKPYHSAELLARVQTHLGFKLARDRERKLVKEIKQLSGLIPICAHCKKVRDDQGFWQQVEEYVSGHTEALFSHGLCQECAPLYFPTKKKPTAESNLSAPVPNQANCEAIKPTILLVDDAPANIQTLVQMLRDRHKLLIANGGVVALEIAAEKRPDLILLDVVMPDMDGHEVCRRLKEDPATQSIPIIFVTGKNAEEDEITGLELGAVDYISKPFRLPIVQARVKTHLKLKQYRDLLERQSTQDALTGLSNRRRYEEFLDSAWRQAIRQRTPLAAILVDVDHFKLFNDHYGHQAGDECLRLVAQALNGARPRTTDLVARYGGEEFVAVLPGTDREGALQVAERLRSAVEALGLPHAHSSAAEHVTASLGVAFRSPKVDEVCSTLIEAADQALYRAKQGGRNRVEG